MKDYRMLLYPQDDRSRPVNREDLVAALAGCGLVASLAAAGQQWLQPGPRFLELITFLGCAPSARLSSDAPGAQGDLNRIRLNGPWPAPRLLSTSHSLRSPRCPHCRATMTRPDPPFDPMRLVDCAGCGESTRLAALNWRHSAAFGRLAIEIYGVFEGEAVPADELLKSLRQFDGGSWNHAYCCDPG